MHYSNQLSSRSKNFAILDLLSVQIEASEASSISSISVVINVNLREKITALTKVKLRMNKIAQTSSYKSQMVIGSWTKVFQNEARISLCLGYFRSAKSFVINSKLKVQFTLRLE